jgi:hypothetical protein
MPADDSFIDVERVNIPKDPRSLGLHDLGQKAARRLAFDGVNALPIPVPNKAEFFCAFAEVGNGRIEIDGIANASTTLVVHEDSFVMMYPISPGQSMSGWGASGAVVGIRFLGRDQ